MLVRVMGWSGAAGHLLRAVQLRTGLANLAGVATVFGYLALSAGKAGLATTPDRLALIGATLAMITAALVGPFVERWAFEPVRHWLELYDTPTARQRRAILAQPQWQAALNFSYWLVAAVVFAIISASSRGSSAGDVSRVVSALILAGLMSSGLAFLLVERRLRPVYALALYGVTPEQAERIGVVRIGIRLRLMLSWALGSGVALLGILVQPLSHVRGTPFSNTPALYLAVVGLVAGAVLIYGAADSVTEPLRQIEDGMRRVASGDLTTGVIVDDAGEVGILQSGYNAMLAGLRERERLDDLFGRHVGVELARQALRRETVAEVREVSALLVDIVGSTELAFTKSPAAVVADLNALFAVVVSVVQEEGGWINRFIGDSALCVFGALGEQPDHAARALRAGRALRDRVAALAARNSDLDVGIGISSGAVLAGNVGAAERYEYTVIGDAVNEAARLTELAKTHPDRILASEPSVVAAAGTAGDWRYVGDAVLRGRHAPTRLYIPGP